MGTLFAEAPTVAERLARPSFSPIFGDTADGGFLAKPDRLRLVLGNAVTIDTGDAVNIDPKAKAEVGDRLARCALANHYLEKIPCAGPTLSSVERLPSALRLHFTLIEGA